MTGAVTWGLLGVAVLAVPTRVAERSSRVGRRRQPSAVGVSRAGTPAARGRGQRGGPVVAAVSAGAACVALFGTSRGGMIGAVVAVLVWIGLSWLQRRPTAAAPDPGLPLALDLIAAGLRAGQPLADALALAADAARGDVASDLLRVAGLCRLGADAPQAWSVIATDGPLAAVVPVAMRSAQSGIKIAGAFERLATELRAEQGARRATRAHRAGVLALGPLAACFLPAFLCLGVVPVIAGIASTALGVLPGGR